MISQLAIIKLIYVLRGYNRPAPLMSTGADPGFFFRRGCTRLLLYFNTNKPHSFFFLQNTSCIRKPQVISQVPPPRSAPGLHVVPHCKVTRPLVFSCKIKYISVIHLLLIISLSLGFTYQHKSYQD